MGALAAAIGLIDFWGIDRVREHTAGWIHALGNTTVLVVALVSWWLGWTMRPRLCCPGD